MQNNISITKNLFPKAKPSDENALGFGHIFTDHMFMMDYKKGEGWLNARIVPYGPLLMEPSSMILHYGQGVFEGLKAYRRADGGLNLFRPRLNFERMNISNLRMGIPEIDVDFCLKALQELLAVEQAWVPSTEGTSLYIRPFIISTDPYVGVRASYTYTFMIILSPSGAYYPEGLNPVSIRIEDKYVRAVRGGTGSAKCPGNYAASILSQEESHAMGFSQVLWLDGVERKYIEEVGSMNFMFVRNGDLYTPELNGSILPGITRRSVLELLGHWGINVIEQRISLDELLTWAKAGEISEAFGTGTAAVISPVGKLVYEDQELVFNQGKIGELCNRIYEYLTGIQYGRLADPLNWVMPLK